MPANLPTHDFGSQLKYLRKRAHLTQRDLAQAVGYTEAHICRLEKNERLPDLTTVAALFIPALDLRDNPEAMERLLQLAAEAHGGRRQDLAGCRRHPRISGAHLLAHTDRRGQYQRRNHSASTGTLPLRERTGPTEAVG